MKKRIWIMNHYAGNMFQERGGRHYWFAKFLKEAGCEPVVFCCNAKHNAQGCYYDTDALWTEQIAEEIGVPFVFVKARAYTGNGKQRILNILDFYRNVKKAAKEYAAAHGRPDVILASSVHPLTILAGEQLAKRFGVRCVAEVRDLWPESIVVYGIAGPHNPAIIALRWLEKWIYTRADAVVFTMEGSYDYIRERHWEKAVPESKVHCINNGVNLELFDYNREHFRLEDLDLDDQETFKVVYTGSIRRVNSLGGVLDAAKLATDSRIKFLIWGGGDELESLQRRVADEGISNVVFKGKVEKKYIPSIVSRADLNFLDGGEVSIMRFGCSANKLFEYFAAGKPVLTNIQVNYNLIDRYEAGISLNNSSAEATASSLVSFTNLSPEVYAQYCANARRAAKDYDFKVLTQKLIDTLDV